MLKTVTEKGYEISTDGRVVWVNAPDGMCVGRFTKSHVDVHHNTANQLEGKHCLDCFSSKERPLDDSWEQFKKSIKENFNLLIKDTFKPKRGK